MEKPGSRVGAVTADENQGLGKTGSRRSRPLWARLGPSVLAVALGLIASWAVPIVLGEEFLVRQIARVYAPLVGRLQGTAQRDAISVLVIDDASLQRAGQSWPADYAYYARLIDSLTVHKPRAIFIDVMFAAQRNDPTIRRLLDSACHGAALGTRIYFAARRDATGRFALRPDIEAAIPRCLQKVAVEYEPDQADQTAWTYSLARGAGDHESASSVASAIYTDLGGVLPAHLHADLAVNWGLPSSQRGLEWLETPSAVAHDDAHAGTTQESSYCRDAHATLLELLPVFIHRLFEQDAAKPICVFHNTLYPADFATGSEEEEAELAAQIQGRVIMIGTALQGSNDRVLSPLHGRIPGVYMHAMALDNLLFYGNDFKRAAHVGLDADGLRVWALILLGLAIIVGARASREWLRERLQVTSDVQEPRWRRKVHEALHWAGWKLGFLAAYFLFFTVMLLVGQRLLNVGFLTVIHVALFSFAAEWLEWNESLWNWLTDQAPHGHRH